MALHNMNLRLLFLLYSILMIPLLSQPVISDSAPAPSPESEPASGPSPSPSPGPSPGPSPSSGPSPSPSPSPGPSPGPSPSSGPSPGPSPSSGPSPGPSPASGPSPSPSSSSSPSPGPSAADEPTDAESPFNLSLDVVDPKLRAICNATDHPELCLTTVVPLLDGKTDVSSVLDVAIRVGAEASRDGLLSVEQVAADPATPPALATILKNCKESCSRAVDNYQSAIGALPERDKGTINSMLSAVITNIGDCEDALAKQGGPTSSFTTTAVKLRSLTSNCLAIVSQLD